MTEHDEFEFPVDPGISSLSSFNLREARLRDVDLPDQTPTEEQRALAEQKTEEEKKKQLAALEELTSLNEQEKDDFDQVRTNITKIMEEGGKTLQEMLKTVKYSESASMFQAAATLIRAIAETNMDLINVHEKKIGLVKRKKDIMSDVLKVGQAVTEEAQQTGNMTPIQVNGGSVFVGTTADLGKMFDRHQKQKDLQASPEVDVTPSSSDDQA